MGAYRFGFRGIYGNMRLASADSGDPVHDFNIRAPYIASRINETQASVAMFCESTINSWRVLDDMLPTWDCAVTISRLVMWDSRRWTMSDLINLPMTPVGTKDINMVRLTQKGKPNNWIWLVCVHLAAGSDSTNIALRSTEIKETIAAINLLGTNRWVLYGDFNEYDEAAGGVRAQARAAGYLGIRDHKQLVLPNRNMNTFNSYSAPPTTTLANGQWIDEVYTDGRGTHAVKHVNGRMMLSTQGESDHNWFDLTSIVP